MARQDDVNKVKAAAQQLKNTTVPVVQQVLEIAQKTISQAASAVTLVSTKVEPIANAAVNVVAAQADLAGSGSSGPGNPGPGPVSGKKSGS